MKPSAIVTLIGIIFGVGLILIGVLRPAFAWNFDAIQSVRSTLGNTVTAVFLIVAGIAAIGTSMISLRKRG